MRSSRNGFTLLEVLLAVVLFTTGAIAVITAINVGIFSVTDVEDTNLAVNIAQAAMEGWKNTAFSSIASVSAAADATFPRFTVTTNVTTVVTSYLKRIDVTVAWPTKGGTTGITLTTLRAAS